MVNPMRRRPTTSTPIEPLEDLIAEMLEHYGKIDGLGQIRLWWMYQTAETHYESVLAEWHHKGAGPEELPKKVTCPARWRCSIQCRPTEGTVPGDGKTMREAFFAAREILDMNLQRTAVVGWAQPDCSCSICRANKATAANARQL